MSDRFLVIGSNSFSGSHFVDFLLNQDAEVTGISRSDEPPAVFLPYKTNARLSRFQFHRLDLNHDLDSIVSVAADFRPGYIVNFAAQSMVAESWNHPEHWFQTNAVANVKLHDQIRKFDFLKKYVHVSTPEVYGNCVGNVKEDAPYSPSSPYAASRAACDLSLMTFFRHYGFPVVFTRAANVFGPGQQLYRIIPRTILYILMGKKLPLHGGGHSVRSFIHIRDVADGTFRVATQAQAPHIYHFSTPRQITIRSVVEMICDKLGVRIEDFVESTSERPGKDAAYLLDSSKARNELGWKDQVELETGIDETIKWIKRSFLELRNQPLAYIHKP